MKRLYDCDSDITVVFDLITQVAEDLKATSGYVPDLGGNASAQEIELVLQQNEEIFDRAHKALREGLAEAGREHNVTVLETSGAEEETSTPIDPDDPDAGTWEQRIYQHAADRM